MKFLCNHIIPAPEALRKNTGVGSSGGRGRGDGGGNNLILSLQERNPTPLLMPGDRGCIREGEEMGEPEERRGSLSEDIKRRKYLGLAGKVIGLCRLQTSVQTNLKLLTAGLPHQ